MNVVIRLQCDWFFELREKTILHGCLILVHFSLSEHFHEQRNVCHDIASHNDL